MDREYKRWEGLKVTATKFKEMWLPFEQIAQATSLPLETIKQL